MTVAYARFRETPGSYLKKLVLKEQNLQAAELISSHYNLHLLTSRILAARGFLPGVDLTTFLSPSLKNGLLQPSGLKNLEAAAALIGETVNQKSSIAVCCDFDVDGLSGGAQLKNLFTQLGIVSEVFVPDRFNDGYGLNSSMVQEASARGHALLIAVDYGTHNAAELRRANELGLKTVVIDHHHVGETICPADVFINPQQNGCGFADGILCASGLCWYLVCAVIRHLKRDDIDPKTFLDLACLGTICDMVPMRGLNRVIASRGLELLTVSERPGIVALKKAAGIGKNVSASDVGFGLGPRINAAGRMKHGSLVIELLTTEEKKLAEKIANELNACNAKRQEKERRVKQEAIKQIERMRSIPPGIVAWDRNFHTGVVGIVAQRLAELFYRPSVVIGSDSNGVFRGSVRGIPGFNVVDALSALSRHLITYGGHEGAGGFSIEENRIESFTEDYIAECKNRFKQIESEPIAFADTEAEPADLTLDVVKEISRLSPFGVGNPNPTVMIRNVTVREVKTLAGTHLKATLTDGKKSITGVLWGQNSHPALNEGCKIDVIVKPTINVYNGYQSVQGVIQAAREVL